VSESFAQALEIVFARNLDRSELGQVAGEKLRIQKYVCAGLHARYEVDQRHLAGISLARKHALAEERAAEADAVEAAGQSALAPALHGVRMTRRVQRGVEPNDLVIDPAIVSSVCRFRAGAHHVDEGKV